MGASILNVEHVLAHRGEMNIFYRYCQTLTSIIAFRACVELIGARALFMIMAQFQLIFEVLILLTWAIFDQDHRLRVILANLVLINTMMLRPGLW